MFFAQGKAAKAFASRFLIYRPEFRHFSSDQLNHFLSSRQAL
jgi:hypothetical protein